MATEELLEVYFRPSVSKDVGELASRELPPVLVFVSGVEIDEGETSERGLGLGERLGADDWVLGQEPCPDLGSRLPSPWVEGEAQVGGLGVRIGGVSGRRRDEEERVASKKRTAFIAAVSSETWSAPLSSSRSPRRPSFSTANRTTEAPR